MKNLKKVLALVLAFACAFTMFAGAVVYPDVPAGSDYSEAITMLSDLGIIQGKDDGKYHSEDTITRAEACALIARMLTGDPQVSQYAGASNFTDVVKGSWKESVVGYCVVNGITVGVGNNKFEPDRAITDAEFVTMVVRAMGYETTGTSYPYGHISAAQANGLLDDVTVVPSSAALRGEDAQIIYNALFADYARGAKQVNTTHGTTMEKYPTIAEDVFGLDKALVGDDDKTYVGLEDDSKVKCEAHTWVILGADPRSENTWVAAPIEDDEVTLYTDAKDYMTFVYEGDATALRGFQVELWGETQHKTSKPEIKAIKTIKGQTAYGNDIDDVDYDKTYVTTLNLDNDGYVKTAKSEFAWEVGAKDLKDAKKDFNGEKYLDDNNNNIKFTFVDWDSDGDVDFTVWDKLAYGKVDTITKSKVVVKTNNGVKESFDIDEDKETVKLDGVEEGDIVEISLDRVYDKKEGEVLAFTFTAIDPETKELTKRSTKNEYYFDGEQIDIATAAKWDFIETNAFDKDDLGLSFDLYLDCNGNIVYSDYAEDEAYKVAMVLDTGAGSSTTNNRKLAAVDLKYADNTVEEDVKVNNSVKVNVTGAYDSTDREFDEAKVVGKLFKVYTNEDGEITKMKALATGLPKVVDANGNVVDTDGDYEFDSKKDRIKIDNVNYDLIDDEGIFAVKAGKKNNGTKVKSYILKNGNDYRVDKDDVLAVSVDDLPDIGGASDTEDKRVVGIDMAIETNNKFCAVDVNDDREITAAILGVDSFDKFSIASVKVGLITVAGEQKGDKKGEVIYTMQAAVNGEYTELSTKSVDNLDDVIKNDAGRDVFEDIMNGKAKEVGYGIYAELTFDSDNKVVEIDPMDVDGVDLKGDYYTVKRFVIDEVKSNYISVLKAKIAAKDELYSAYSPNDHGDDNDYDVASDIKYYTINKVYPGKNADTELIRNVIGASQGFEKNIDGKIEIASDLESSNIYNSVRDDKLDEYVVADLVIKDDEVVAAYQFDKIMKEAGANEPAIVAVPEFSVETVKAGVGAVGAADAQDAYTTVEFTKQDQAEIAKFKVNGVDVAVEITDTEKSSSTLIADKFKEAVEDSAAAANVSVTVAGNKATLKNAYDVKQSVPVKKHSSNVVISAIAVHDYVAAVEPADAVKGVAKLTITKNTLNVASANVIVRVSNGFDSEGNVDPAKAENKQVTLKKSMSTEDIAKAIKDAFASNGSFDVVADGSVVTFTQKVASDVSAFEVKMTRA